MTITLLYLVKENTLANAFPVDIEKDQLDDLLRNLTLNDGDELFAIREITLGRETA
uniref:Uncharacterized protein n=1 Tax=Rhizophagus irregularis (strain DAOM 181602 / DAOM 197198 / MUCL 43194) TaxID=747089 RepID=U9U6N3_RHIID